MFKWCPECDGELHDRTAEDGAGAWVCESCENAYCPNCREEIELRCSEVTRICKWLCECCRAGIPSPGGSIRGIYAVRGNGEDKAFFDWPWLPEAPEDCELLAAVRLPAAADVAPIMRQLPSKGTWGLRILSADMSSRKILVVDGASYGADDVLRGEAPKSVEVLWRRRPLVAAVDDPQCPDCGEIMDGESGVGLCYACRFKQTGVGRVRAVYRHREEQAMKVLDLAPFQGLPEEYEIVAVVRIRREALGFFMSSPVWCGEAPDEIEMLWRLEVSNGPA